MQKKENKVTFLVFSLVKYEAKLKKLPQLNKKIQIFLVKV